MITAMAHIPAQSMVNCAVKSIRPTGSVLESVERVSWLASAYSFHEVRNAKIPAEAMPDFVGVSGEVEGMDSMTMPFPVAAEVDLDGFAVGDPVRFDLEVDWQADRPIAVTAMVKLPPETELALD